MITMLDGEYAVQMDQKVTYEKAGSCRLFTNPDADEARAFFRGKSRMLVNKVTTTREAVETLVRDGDHLGVGGLGTNQVTSGWGKRLPPGPQADRHEE